MMRSFLLVAVLAAVSTVASIGVGSRTTVVHAEIMGCERGCSVVSAGFPAPFVVDYPGLSVVNRVSWSGALVGEDKLLWGRLGASFAFWLAVSSVVVWAGRRVWRSRRSMPPRA